LSGRPRGRALIVLGMVDAEQSAIGVSRNFVAIAPLTTGRREAEPGL
jgi:hypothetical protein